jgi:hypothetical protein
MTLLDYGTCGLTAADIFTAGARLGGSLGGIAPQVLAELVTAARHERAGPAGR